MVKKSNKKEQKLKSEQDDLGLFFTFKNKILNYLGFDNIFNNDELYSNALNDKGHDFYQKNEITKAREYFIKAIKRNKNNKYALTNLAIIYSNQNNFEQAISFLKKAISVNKNYLRAYEKLGLIYFDQKNFQQAIKYFKMGVNINPNYQYMQYNLAIAYKNNKQIQLAIKHFEVSLEIDEQNRYAYYNLGLIYSDQKLIDNAIKYFQQAIKIYPNYSDAHFELGLNYQKLQFFDLAVECFKKVIEINPNQIRPYFILFEIYFNQKNLAQSFKFYERAKNINPCYTYDYIGCMFYNKRYYSQSIQWFKKALEIDKNSLNIIITLADAYYYNNQRQLADEFLNSVLKNHSEMGYEFQSKIYLRLKQFDKAINCLNKLLKIETSKQKRYKYYCKLGEIYQNKKYNYNMAIRCYQNALQYWSFYGNYDDGLYQQLANAYFHDLQYEQAIDSYQKQIIINEDKKFLHYNMGEVYLIQAQNSFYQDPKRYEDGTLPVYKSHSVLTLTTYPQSSRRRKRVRLNDSLSYCSIINDSHQNRQHSSLTQNHSSSSSSFQPSLKKIYVGSSNVDLSTQETIQSQFRSSIYDYQSYIQSFPDYRLRRICSYKYLKHIDHQNNTLNKSQSQQSQKYQHFDYKNLCMLFQDKYFSVQLIDSLNLQEKCLNFVQSYQLSIPSNIQLNSNFSSKQEEEEEENTANQTYLNQNEINFQINSSQLQQFEKENNIIVKQKAKLQINQQLQKNTRSFKRKQEVLTEIENTKTKRPNSRYQILVKNIQYETIKEITDIQKIEFSKRTISKVITKFILFLKGDYRTLKYYDLEQKCQNGTAQRILKNQDPQQFSDEDQNTQAPNFNQNCSFELPKFNLFELLEEQDHKEMLQTDSNSVNKGVNSVRNQRYSLTSNSSQGQCDKFIKEAVRDQYQIHKQNQHHSSFQSTPINQNLDKSQVCINATVKINEDLCPSQDEQQASQSISNSPKANFNKLKQINLQRKQSESSFCPEGYLNPINNNNNDSKIQIKSKQTLFNLSKYLMHLILEYLSEEHLDGLQIIPGFQSLIQNVVKRIKKKGQRTEHSQTYYYNHSHYNCLFLLLSDGNIEYVQNQKELMELHQYVYEINDFIKAFDLTQINFIKAIVARLIIKQFKLIRQLIDQQIQLNPIKYQTYNNYMITKLQYFERVYQGIKNLKKGQILVRF